MQQEPTFSTSSKNDFEAKLTFLEYHVEEQDRVILELRREVDLLIKEIKQVKADRETDSRATSRPSNEERPPHY